MSTHHTAPRFSKNHLQKSLGFLAAASMLLLTACGNESAAETSETADGVRSEVSIGINDIDLVWETFVDIAERDHGIDVELVTFTDLIMPNEALVNGEIDVNAFQHVYYLSEFNHSNETDLKSVALRSTSIVGLYSETIQNLEDLPDGASLLVGNDPTNQGRSLQFLEELGLITLDEDAGLLPALPDITENPQNFEFVEIASQQLPLSLPDVDAAVIYQFVADRAGVDRDLVISTDADYLTESAFLPYTSVFAARAEDADDPTWEIFHEIYQSEAIQEAYETEFQGSKVFTSATLEEIQELQTETEATLE